MSGRDSKGVLAAALGFAWALGLAPGCKGHGAITIDEPDSDADTDADTDSDADTDTDADADTDSDADTDTDADTGRPLNSPPIGSDDSYIRGLGCAACFTVQAPGVLGNDTDPDGDPLEALLLAPPVDGTVTLQPDGSFTFCRTAFRPLYTWEYQVSDGLERSGAVEVVVVNEDF